VKQLHPWWVSFKDSPNPKLTLLCFSYAGGSPLTFHEWHKWLDPRVRVVSVLLPGRATRIMEPAIDKMDVIVDALLPSIQQVVEGDYAMFGHSLGSRVALQLCKKLKEVGGQLPSHFFASGSSAPHKPSKERILYNLPDKEFIEELGNLNGTPREVLENKELMQLYLPMLRADFKIADTFKYEISEKLPVDLSIFRGELDHEVQVESSVAWREVFDGTSEFVQFKGDHFFIEEYKQQVVVKVMQKLGHLLQPRAVA
jgi:surfactin synthase thioesterase subunit